MSKDTEVEVTKTHVVEKPEDSPSNTEDVQVQSNHEVTTLGSREDIYAKFDKENRPTSEDDDPEEQPLEEEPEEEPEEDDPEELPEEDVPDEEPKKVKKVKIYGEVREVDEAVVEAAGGITEYQKKVAAAEKAQFQRDRAELEQEKQALAAERRELEKNKTALPKDEPAKKDDLPSDDHVEKVQAEIKNAAESLLDGDVDAFTDKITSIVGQNNNTQAPVDVDEIVDKVTSRTTQTMDENQRKRELQDAFKDFSAEYPDLVANPDLYKEVDQRTVFHKQINPEASPLEIMRLAADEVIRLNGLDEQQPNARAKKSRDDKKAEKRSMRKPKSGSMRSERKPEPKPQTRSDYIAEIQRQRGQA